MSSDVRAEIISAIAKTDDMNMKVVLLMMLGVFDEIIVKIDAMRDDELGLRQVVLNGHMESHDHHHEWVARKITEEEENAKENKASARKIRDRLVENLLWAVLVLIAGASGWVFK